MCLIPGWRLCSFSAVAYHSVPLFSMGKYNSIYGKDSFKNRRDRSFRKAKGVFSDICI